MFRQTPRFDWTVLALLNQAKVRQIELSNTKSVMREPMNYGHDMRVAATRNFAAANILKGTHRKDVAGYLFGIAAECAVKQIMLSINIRPSANKQGDPFYAHFEELKTLLRDRLHGRAAARLGLLINDNRYMQYWDVTMRYAHGNEIKDEWVDRWHADAQKAIIIMEEI